MEKKQKKIDILLVGLALFATYFGAGNLIFPPILGLQSGSNWVFSTLGLTLSGIFLPVLAMIVLGMCGSVMDITKHVTKNFHTAIIGAIMFIVLFVANPRTAATAVELGIQGIVPQIPYAPSVVVYFLLVFYFAKNEGSSLDKIGKILTPAMVIILLILIILGFISPIGTPVDTDLERPFVNAFLGGYQTGDVLVSFLLATVFLRTVESKGYLGKARNKVTIIASIIAFIGLFVVYSGLLYMGASGSGMFPSDIGRAELLVEIIKKIGGNTAMIALGFAVILACLTTAVAQATAAGDYFVTLSKGRLKYKWSVAGTCIISTMIALIGVDKIVVFSNPIYATIYPVVLVLLLLGIFKKIIPNDGGYKGAVAFTFIYSLCEAIASIGINIKMIERFVTLMPLAEQGLGWVLPCMTGFIIGTLVYMILKKKSVS